MTGLKKRCHITGHMTQKTDGHLIKRLTEFYKKKKNWTGRDSVQRSTESVEDYHLILSKIFKIHSDITPPVDPTDDSPYEQQENNFFACVQTSRNLFRPTVLHLIRDVWLMCWHMLDMQIKGWQEMRDKRQEERLESFVKLKQTSTDCSPNYGPA